MNKLLFTFERDFNDDVVFVANNEKDLEDYLVTELNYHLIRFYDDYAMIHVNKWDDTPERAELKWIKHI